MSTNTIARPKSQEEFDAEVVEFTSSLEELTRRFDLRVELAAKDVEEFTLKGFSTAANLMRVEKETWARAAETSPVATTAAHA
jgi:hypothetical protein